jgi:hypothetical protein
MRVFFQWSAVSAALLLALAPLAAVDIGVTLDQSVSLDDAFNGGTNGVSYAGTISPWVSGLLTDDGDMYLSMSVTPTVEGGKLFIVPELLRSDVTLRSERGTSLRFGRMPYVDPTGLVARGLFDGVELSQDAGGGSFSLGGWFTGLQYKKSANITVSPLDEAAYYTEFNADDMNTYFASRRILASVGYEHPAIGELVRLRTALMGQFDVNGENDRYNSEYFVGKITVPYKNQLMFDAGWALELLQSPDTEHVFGFAAELGAAWLPPTALFDRLSLTGRYASGWTEDSPVEAFTPLSTVAQGNVLKAKLSSLAHIRAGYTARLHETFSIDTAASYFLRTARPAFAGDAEETEEYRYALGGELYLSMIWSPVSDIRVQWGSGLFMPGLGDVNPAGLPRWLFEMSASVALF